MSRVVERLLPPLCAHLGGPLAFPADSATATGGPSTSGTEERRTAHHHLHPAAPRVQATTDAALEQALEESYRRWRHCFQVWRKVLGNDVLLLTLLLHAGCLWSPQYGALRSAASTVKHEWEATQPPGGDAVVSADITAAALLHQLSQHLPLDLWALHVISFLGLVEVYEDDLDSSSDDDDDDGGGGGGTEGDDINVVSCAPHAGEPHTREVAPSLPESQATDHARHHHHHRSRSRHRQRRRVHRSHSRGNDDTSRSRSRHRSHDVDGRRHRHRSRSQSHGAGRTSRRRSASEGSRGRGVRARIDASPGTLQDLLPAPFAAATAVGATPPPAVVAALLGTTPDSSAAAASRGSRRGAGHGRLPPGGGVAAGYGSPLSPAPQGVAATGSSGTGSVLTPQRQRQLLCKACVSVTYSDEPLVQLTAAWLVDDWLELLSLPPGTSDGRASCALTTLRHYWLSSALKFAGYVDGTHSALLEENAHVQAVLARQAVSPAAAAELFQRSIPSILCCLLRDEAGHPGSAATAASLADDGEAGELPMYEGGPDTLVPRPLYLPPLAYLLPFQSVARGSRVAVWVPNRSPREGTADGGVERGEYHLFRVTSHGACLSNHDTGTIAPLSFCLRWLDEEDAGGGNSTGFERQRRRRSRSRSRPLHSSSHTHTADGTPLVSVMNGLLPRVKGGAEKGSRLWSAAVRGLRGHVRLDVNVSRVLLMRPIPARDLSKQDEKDQQQLLQATATSGAATAASGDGGAEPVKKKRAGGGGGGASQEVLLTLLSGVYSTSASDVLATLQRRLQSSKLVLSHQRGIGGSGGSGGMSSRATLARDPLGTILQFLHLTARRMLALHGSCVQQQQQQQQHRPESSKAALVAPTAEAFGDVGGGAASGGKRGASGGTADGARPPLPPGGRGAGGAKARPPGAAPWLSWGFSAPSAELHALLECAQSLSLAALTHAHNLPDSLLDQPAVSLWLTEVAALIADLATLTRAPVRRCLRAAGFALCLLPARPQSVLIAVGLYAELGTRQLATILGRRAHAERAGSPGRRRGGDVQDAGEDAEDGVCFWWSAFQAAVLTDAYLPAQLHPTTWALEGNLSHSLQHAMQVRARDQAHLYTSGTGARAVTETFDAGLTSRTLNLRPRQRAARVATEDELAMMMRSRHRLPLAKRNLSVANTTTITAVPSPAAGALVNTDTAGVQAAPLVGDAASAVAPVATQSGLGVADGACTVVVIADPAPQEAAAEGDALAQAVASLWVSLERSLRVFMAIEQHSAAE